MTLEEIIWSQVFGILSSLGTYFICGLTLMSLISALWEGSKQTLGETVEKLSTSSASSPDSGAHMGSIVFHRLIGTLALQ